MLVVLFVCLSFFYFITMFGGFVVFVDLCVFRGCLFVCFGVGFGCVLYWLLFCYLSLGFYILG